MKPVLRTLGWAVAAIWATGMTVALSRISGTLDAIASRPPTLVAASPALPTLPSEVAISQRAAPAQAREAPAVNEPLVAEATPEQQAAREQADAVLAQIIQKGRTDDDSTQALRQALAGMRSQDRIHVLSAFAAAATRGEIAAAPEDYRRILP